MADQQDSSPYAPPSADTTAPPGLGPLERVYPAKRRMGVGEDAYEFRVDDAEYVIAGKRHPKPGYELRRAAAPGAGEGEVIASVAGVQDPLNASIDSPQGAREIRAWFATPNTHDRKPPHMHVELDGVPLRDSAADPFEAVKFGRMALNALGALYLARAISLRALFGATSVHVSPLTVGLFGIPAVLLFVAAWNYRKRPMSGTVLGLGLGAVDLFLFCMSMLVLIGEGRATSLVGIVMGVGIGLAIRAWALRMLSLAFVTLRKAAR